MEEHITSGREEVNWDCVNWIQLAQEEEKRDAAAKTLLDLHIPQN
jgi:hypothetical protein